MPVIIITRKMEVSNYLKKFKLLVEYVFEGKVVLNENTTEKLLNFLEDRSDNSECTSVLSVLCLCTNLPTYNLLHVISVSIASNGNLISYVISHKRFI